MMTLHPAVERRIAGGLLLAMAILLGLGVLWDGMTVDEMVYIGSGYRALQFSDYRMNPEQPPLAKMIAAAPLIFLPLEVPPAQEGDAQITWSDTFVHEANVEQPVLACARVPIVLCTLALAVLVWRVARRFYGHVAGLVALGLLAFHPSLLAHGHLATTDLVSALTLVLCSWAFCAWSLSPRLPRAIAVGLSLGAAVTTRFTAWLLVPILGVLLLLWMWDGRRQRRSRSAVPVLTLAGATVLAVTAVVWAVYGFHFEPWPGRSSLQPIGPNLGWPGWIVGFLAEQRLLPESYLEGLRFQLDHARGGHWAYFMGQSGSTGWWSYYLVAFLIKNTPGFLVVTLGVIVLLFRRPATILRTQGHWLVPAVVFFFAASVTRLQLGERYILAVYPYLALLAAAGWVWLASRRLRLLLLAVTVLSHALPAVVVTPRGHLTYFNSIAGGPEGGHRWLADSNLDWGQDLPRLARWMKEKGVSQIQLGYFGADDPDRYGIAHEDLPAWYPNRPQRPAPNPFHGTIAVSANLVLGFLFSPHDDPYAFLRDREPDERVGVFFTYRLP